MHGGMEPCLHGAHHFHRPLHQGERGPDRGLLVAVADLQVGDRREAPALFDQAGQQRRQNLAGLLVGEEGDSIADRARRHIDIAELAGHQRRAVALDPETAGLQAGRQVRQGAGVDQLSQDGCGGFGDAADQVHQAEAVDAPARDVGVLGEPHPLGLAEVAFDPVAADRQDGRRALVDGHDIGQRHLIRVLEAFQVQIGMNFQQGVPIVELDGRALTLQVVGLALDIRVVGGGLGEGHVPVEARDLQLADFVGVALQDVGVARCRLQVGGAVGHHEVLGRDEHRDRPPQSGIVVGLLEAGASQRQGP
jgi:hypothetical protein